VSTRSTLGDLIIEHGPWAAGSMLTSAAYNPDAMNVLREELIELRARDTPEPEPCQAETHSWDHLTPEQVDSYWIRCTLHGPHGKHEDEHTGLTWHSEASDGTDVNA